MSIIVIFDILFLVLFANGITLFHSLFTRLASHKRIYICVVFMGATLAVCASPLRPPQDVQTEVDSAFLESLIDSIYETGQSPEKSLMFVRIYKQIAREHPEIPNRLARVELLRGYRYNGIAWRNNKTDFEKAERYLDSAQMVFDAIGYEEGTWLNLYGRAAIHKNRGKNEEALRLYDNYLEHYSMPFDSEYVANVQYQRGIVLQQMGRIQESTEAILTSVRLDEGLGRYPSAANSLNSIANGYKVVRLYDQAEAYYKRAFAVYEEQENQKGMALIIINHANMLSEKGAFTDALDKYRLAESWSLAIKDSFLLAHIYEDLGNTYMLMDQDERALRYLDNAYSMKKQFNSPRELYMIEIKLGKLALKARDTERALDLIGKAYTTALNLNETDQAKETAGELARIYAQRGDFRSAYSYAQAGRDLQDSIINRDISRAVTEMNTRYETEKKEQSIQLLTSENMLKASRIRQSRIIAGLTGIALLLVSLLALRIARDRKKIQELNTVLNEKNRDISVTLEEKNILLKEIHHRVKNNLQVISSLLGIQSRKIEDEVALEALQESRSRVNSMSLIHQDLYQHDNLKGIRMPGYFNKLIMSLFKTYNISSDDITIETDIDDLILDVDSVIPLGLIVNELMSNVLKYAFPQGRGKILVRLTSSADHLKLEVSDNGVGMKDPDEVIQKESFGFDLIKALIDKLDGELSIEVDGGTAVRMIIRSFKLAA